MTRVKDTTDSVVAEEPVELSLFEDISFLELFSKCYLHKLSDVG